MYRQAMKIMLVGASGLIGAKLARALMAQGHEVIGASRSRPQSVPLSGWT